MEQLRDTHHLDVIIAVKCGVPAAIVIYHLRWWIIQNRANKRHNHDGRTWTYNSIEAFAKIWPYWKPRQIRYIFEFLIAEGIILSGNFNTKKNDRTLWYAFVDETAFLGEFDILQNCQMALQKRKIDLTKMSNPSDKTVKCIGTDDNQINNQIEEKENFSRKGLSVIKKREEENVYSLLLRFGVEQKVARRMAFEQHHPLESVENAIKNGLTKKITEPAFVFSAGYIIAALNQAANEAKLVTPSKGQRKFNLQKQLDEITREIVVTPEIFEHRREQVLHGLNRGTR